MRDYFLRRGPGDEVQADQYLMLQQETGPSLCGTNSHRPLTLCAIPQLFVPIRGDGQPGIYVHHVSDR